MRGQIDNTRDYSKNGNDFIFYRDRVKCLCLLLFAIFPWLIEMFFVKSYVLDGANNNLSV